jgi:hypothetical protein
MILNPLLLTLLLTITATAIPNRGLWFWRNTTIPDGIGGTMPSPYGSDLVVGNDTLENDCLAFFKLHHVKRIYGSYGNRPICDADDIADWNEKLDCLRIESQMLLEGISVSGPADLPNYLDKITTRFINFNDAHASEPAKQFDGLHLDIEPQQTPPYQGGSAADKRAVLDDLLVCYGEIRNHLNTNGYAHLPIYADIPFTWDKIPGSIGWSGAADRDAWFVALKEVLDGLSIMTFSKDTAPELDDATAYERAGALDGFSRIAIQPKIGIVDPPAVIWPDYPTFNGVLNDLETLIEEDECTDIENFGFWRHAIDTTGLGYLLRNRGLWFWEQNSFENDTVNIYDGLSVVGHAAREADALNFISNRQVRRLYGEYTNRPVTEPSVIAAWNTKLHHLCIDSQSIFRGKDTYLASFKPDLLTLIQNSFVGFMDAMGSDGPSRFKALRLRLSPQDDFSWPVWTPAFRRTQLDNILVILTDTRALLDSSGYPHIPLFADIGHDWDLMPIDGGLIGWTGTSDRDNWFQQVHQVIDGVSVLSFPQTIFFDIENVSNYERSAVLPTKAIIGMKSDIGLIGIWPNLTAFQNEMAVVENTTGPAQSVDIDNFARWRLAVKKSSPVIHSTGVAVAFDFVKPTHPVIVIDAEPNHLYIVRLSHDLDDPRNAREVARLRTTSGRPEKMRIPLDLKSLRAESGFWLIERIKD